MSRTPSISFRANSPSVVIRRDFLDICDQKHCASLVLSQMMYWHEIKSAHRGQAIATNRQAAAVGKAANQHADIWIWKKQAELQAELLNSHGVRAVGDALTFLVDRGYLADRPNPYNQYDRTLQYSFRADVVQSAIDALPRLTDEMGDDAPPAPPRLRAGNEPAKMPTRKSDSDCVFEPAKTQTRESHSAVSSPQKRVLLSENTSEITNTENTTTDYAQRSEALAGEDRVVVVAPIHIDAQATSVRDPQSKRENTPAQATSVRVIKNDLPEKTEVGSVLPVQVVVALSQNTPATIDLARRLTDVGITPQIATELAERFPERIAAQLAYLPHRDARSPAGVLKTAIEGDWEAPPKYRAVEEAEARQTRASTDKADLIARIKQSEESAQRRKRAFEAAWQEMTLERQQEVSRGAWREIAAGSGPIAARAKDVLRGEGLAGTALVAVHQTALERLVMSK